MSEPARVLLDPVFPAEDDEYEDLPPDVPRPPREEDLPSEDGVPLETNLHRLLMNLLIEVISVHWRDRRDYFVSGNMFIYYSSLQSKKNDFRGPDFFVVLDTELRQRDKWIVWKEHGRSPNVVIELTSPSTEAQDRGMKKRIYEKVLRVPDYFIYDPRTHALDGFQLAGGAYEPIPMGPDGRMRCEALGLSLGLWEGPFQGLRDTYLRFFDTDGAVLPTEGEYQEQRRQQAEQQRQQAEQRTLDLEARLREYEQRFGALPGGTTEKPAL